MKRGNTKAFIKDFDLGAARDLNLAVGSWLLVSALVWRHSEPQFLVTVLVGTVVAIISPFEVGSRIVRLALMAAGAGLALAAVALPRAAAWTPWHNVIAGLALVVFAFFGPPHGIVRSRPPAPADAYDGTGL